MELVVQLAQGADANDLDHRILCASDGPDGSAIINVCCNLSLVTCLMVVWQP